METKHTPWEIEESDYGSELWFGGGGCGLITVNGWSNGGCKDVPDEWEELSKQALLIAAAPDQHAEMLRHLPILERLEADPELWDRLTAGLGIATLNGYRAAIAKATGSAE